MSRFNLLKFITYLLKDKLLKVKLTLKALCKIVWKYFSNLIIQICLLFGEYTPDAIQTQLFTIPNILHPLHFLCIHFRCSFLRLPFLSKASETATLFAETLKWSSQMFELSHLWKSVLRPLYVLNDFRVLLCFVRSPVNLHVPKARVA